MIRPEPDKLTRHSGRSRHIARAIGTVLLVVIVLAAGWFATVFFIPAVAGSLWVSIVLGGLIVGALSLLIGRIFGGRVLMAGAVVLFLVPFALVLPTAPHGAATAKPAPDGTQIRYWDLPTGSRLGYLEYLPDESNGRPPVIYLHGGPGGGVIGDDFPMAEDLATAGFTVYLYDQAGVGFSDQIDPTDYTVERMIEDLEAVRQTIGPPKVNVVGHSWGGSLAAHYAVAHPDAVAHLILNAPGAYGADPPDEPDSIAPTAEEAGELALKPELPRALFLFALLADNGYAKAADDVIPQQNLPYIAEKYIDFDRMSVVDDQMRYSHFNILANKMLNHDVASYDAEVDLPLITAPTLILRGVNDFIAWPIQRQYRDAIPGAMLVAVANGTHSDRFTAQMINFLSGDTLAQHHYSGSAVPITGS